MFNADGELARKGTVVLIDKRDITIIERSELRRVFIRGNELCWGTANGVEHATEFSWTPNGSDYNRSCEIVVKIFDSIMFDWEDVYWLRLPDGSWKSFETDDEYDRATIIKTINESSKS